MLVIVETKAALLSLDVFCLEQIKNNGYKVAEVEELVVDFGECGEACAFTPEEIENGMKQVRQWLYQNVTDPMFFKAQRGEVAIDDWKSAVEKIKTDWAY